MRPHADLIGKMKKGQGLVVQAINSTGQPISLVMPLADFAKAYDGPPTDPKVFEEQQKKLQDELQRRADEARKKLESQQGQPHLLGHAAGAAAIGDQISPRRGAEGASRARSGTLPNLRRVAVSAWSIAAGDSRRCRPG